jgi:hypothetical protein
MITTARGTSKVSSTCPEFTSIKYATALNGSATTPCTNVPIACELCVCSDNSKTLTEVWHYNMEAHLKSFHPGHNQPLHLSSAFLMLCTIKHEEHIAMGIPKEQILPLIFSSFPTSANSSGSDLMSIAHPQVEYQNAKPSSFFHHHKSLKSLATVCNLFFIAVFLVQPVILHHTLFLVAISYARTLDRA